MSKEVEQLQTDLTAILDTLNAHPPQSVPGLVLFLQDNLLPWMASAAGEMKEMDSAIEDLDDIVHANVDVLHTENAQVFAAVIASGLALALELSQRIGNDQRLLKVIAEYRKVAKESEALLEEITVPDNPEDQEDEDDDEDEEPKEKTAP